ncbi:MAG: FAD-binding protein, partial [Bacteroidetes bacterium]
MPQQVHLRIAPEQLEETQLDTWIAARLGIDRSRINGKRVIRRSLDARGRYPVYDLMVEVWVDEPFSPGTSFDYPLPDVRHAEPVAVVGMGPAGLFAALHLIHLGKKPIIIERGKAVRERRRDLALLNREGIVNPESNYCFGEGGAGTFSDGKLYTRATKRGDVRRSLELLAQFGATPDILIDAHPHIGTNKLPGIIERMREQVIACGGEVLFSTRLTGLEVQFGQLQAALLNDGERLPVKHMILATGHSARD